MRAVLAMLCLGVLLGLGSAAGAIWVFGQQGAVRLGPWRTPLDAGGTGRDMYTRAAVAVGATLGLSRAETLYFAAVTDSDGARLHGNCSYRIAGPDLPSRWWSLTVYGADHYLIPNPAHRYSINSFNAARDADSAFSVRIGPRADGGINTAQASGLIVLLRLYQPRAEEAADPRRLRLPVIERQGCA